MNTSGHLMISLLVCLAILHGTYGAVTWTTPSGGTTHTASIQEDVSPGDAVTTVVASTDAAGATIASYVIGTQVPAGSKFTIATATSGAVTVAAGEGFDHEAQGSYTVEVVATDNATPTAGSATVTITVTVTDVTEVNPAYASATQTNQQICSTSTSGTIGTYTITGHASRLTWNAIAYAIRSGDDAGGNAKFGIASGTGDLIKTSQAFDVATKSEYVLIIDGVSNGAAAATASTTLTVTAVASACSSASVISGSLVAMATVLLSAIINRLL